MAGVGVDEKGTALRERRKVKEEVVGEGFDILLYALVLLGASGKVSSRPSSCMLLSAENNSWVFQSAEICLLLRTALTMYCASHDLMYWTSPTSLAFNHDRPS